ncbi:glycosyltransferase family 2 protein [Limibaculum sp. M0105]|uniref:Glycosyltransferase family 2 protein n=1 Tax=Thermohalobaculum xanthum TaxID=2753746 RepID=A0A8J7M600_9RHOB|nr:glycosyltransferase family A protein [Thermohalobaculum xanthum]MBK0398733.1 glycosyltransferase family 2 protein [Thermohalobaculum xanthum]
MSQDDAGVPISVIVPVWNDPERLRLCLEALGTQTLGREKFEVIVVDNASTDDTPEVARSFDWVRVLTEPKKGSYSARNTGLKHARGTFIAFTDSDCIPAAGWLEAGLARLQAEPGIGVVGGKITLFATDAASSRACINYEKLFAFNQKTFIEKWGVAATANLFCAKALIEAVDGFDASLMSGGDSDLTRRITAQGHRLVYLDEAEVKHPTRGTMREVVRKHLRVKSGVWDRSKNPIKFLTLPVHATRSTAARSLRVLRSHGESPVEKIEVIGLLVSLYGLTLFEYSRRLLGGAARRS